MFAHSICQHYPCIHYGYEMLARVSLNACVESFFLPGETQTYIILYALLSGFILRGGSMT